MRILCLKHAAFETLGVIEGWAKERHYPFTLCSTYKEQTCLNQEEFDFLIIMGGPQCLLEIEKYPYLQQEILLIQKAFQQNKIILGICLGNQLMGEAFGGKTRRSPEKEVGVFPVTLNEAGSQDPLLAGLSSSFLSLHWHDDMAGETAQGTVLASSQGCPNQIVRYGPYQYGFQCHLEFNLEAVKSVMNARPQDFVPGKFIQDPQEMLAQNYTKINQIMITLLDRLIALKLQDHS